MIDFERVKLAGDDLWSDHELVIWSERIASFTETEWQALTRELGAQESIVQERIAQILSDFDHEQAADILLPLAASADREVALTARESLRCMHLKVVAASARRLSSIGQLDVGRVVEFSSINAILDAIEYRCDK